MKTIREYYQETKQKREFMERSFRQTHDDHQKILIAFAPSALISLRLFLWKPMFGCGIACIPLINSISKRLKLTPLMTKVIGLITFSLMIWLSWCFAELVVVFGALAIASDFVTISKIIAEKNKERTIEFYSQEKAKKTEDIESFEKGYEDQKSEKNLNTPKLQEVLNRLKGFQES